MADDDKTTTTCNICTDDKASMNMFTNHECSHSFCKDRISSHIAAKLEDNIANVKCPQTDCQALLHPDICHSFIPKNLCLIAGEMCYARPSF
uniref:RING-type domain-containing protein n=1 Tax=Cucumis melo TaxID=3656 RepID=A0A9I9DRZ0_CUCME